MEILDKALDAFKNFNGWDVADIVLLSLVFFGMLSMLKRYNLLGFLRFLLPAAAILFFCYLMRHEMRATGALAGIALSFFLLIYAIVFRHELRRGVIRLSSPSEGAEHYNANSKYTDEELESCVQEIVKAAINLAKNNVGALIVLTHNELSGNIIESGTRMESLISSPLLECLFNTKAPLHDGAVVVRGNKIVAAGCFLPLTQSMNIPKELGTRHRAAIGVTENADVLTIICSEETGVISVCKRGALQRYFDSKMLTQTLEQFFGLKVSTQKKRGRGARQS